jgi:hypothetical protein
MTLAISKAVATNTSNDIFIYFPVQASCLLNPFLLFLQLNIFIFVFSVIHSHLKLQICNLLFTTYCSQRSKNHRYQVDVYQNKLYTRMVQLTLPHILASHVEPSPSCPSVYIVSLLLPSCHGFGRPADMFLLLRCRSFSSYSV